MLILRTCHFFKGKVGLIVSHKTGLKHGSWQTKRGYVGVIVSWRNTSSERHQALYVSRFIHLHVHQEIKGRCAYDDCSSMIACLKVYVQILVCVQCNVVLFRQSLKQIFESYRYCYAS